MSTRWWTFLIWAVVAASAVYWGLKLTVRPLQAPPQTVLAQPSDGLRGDLSRVLGADTPPTAPVQAAAAPVEDTRFTLVGVLSPRATSARREGVALIALDGKPAKAYKVGAVVEGGKVLQSVGARNATLGPKGGPAVVALSLPALPEAARGTPGGAGAAPLGTPPGAEPGIDAPVQNGGAQQQLGIGPPPPAFVPGMRPGMPPGMMTPPPGAAPTAMPPPMPGQPSQPFNRRVGPGGTGQGGSPQS